MMALAAVQERRTVHELAAAMGSIRRQSARGSVSGWRMSELPSRRRQQRPEGEVCRQSGTRRSATEWSGSGGKSCPIPYGHAR
jgi:hypothetical protein